MTAQEIHDLWKTVWDKCPECRPEGLVFSAAHNTLVGRLRNHWSMTGDYSTKLGAPDACIKSIINWTATEWLAKHHWYIDTHKEQWFGKSSTDDMTTTGHYRTSTGALNAACRAVLEME